MLKAYFSRKEYFLGISKLMITGCSEKSSIEAKQLAEKHSGFLYFTSGKSQKELNYPQLKISGVHPHDAKDANENTYRVLEELQVAFQDLFQARNSCF